MSPIGRVFIVLNVILAGCFVGFSGTFLQRQHTYKTMLETEQKAHSESKSSAITEKAKLEGELAALNIQKTTLETDLGNTKVESAGKGDEIKLLNARASSSEADLKKLASVAEATKTTMEGAFDQSKKAYEQSTSDQKTRDDAVNAKNTAEAENRSLKADIVALNEKGTNRDLQIAALSKDQSELKLLVDVAKAKGFLESMAVPQLMGTISIVSGRLVTVAITDNPTNAEVKPGIRFAIYDKDGYKGEAKVTSVDAERKAAFCTVEIAKGTVKVGDSASTHLAGSQ
ncbi:MAG: hypothetical protein WCR59_07720 [Planctomycetota bacterium]|jgi:hypothetical protein|nr:hypothetical protein [Planctomycetota bacterium]